jgi:hypothetical protein
MMDFGGYDDDQGPGHHDAHDPGEQGAGWHGDERDAVRIIDRPRIPMGEVIVIVGGGGDGDGDGDGDGGSMMALVVTDYR